MVNRISTSCFQAIVFSIALSLPLCAADLIPSQQHVVEQRLMRDAHLMTLRFVHHHYQPHIAQLDSQSAAGHGASQEFETQELIILQPGLAALPQLLNLPPPVC